MSKITNVLLFSVVALGLVACGASPVKEAPKKVADCVFPNTQEAAPGWICDEPVEGVVVSAVGSAEKTAAGIEFMKNMAATAARVQLAQRMKVQVANMVKQYVETTGAGKDESVDKVNTSVTKQITNETLVGTRIFKSRQGPDGTMYVLVGLDEASAQKLTESAVKTSMNNDRALWQKFQAGKSQDEMAAAIAQQKIEAAAAK
ncbi:MAG: hypothetical protein FD173_375 [Gallionellaceae bacterium]|nr:MAG: hypothetical protein FD173_375 [Gallionellaceae bacterium]